MRWKTICVRVPIPEVPWCLFGHKWSGWFESLGRYAIGKRHRQCLKCGKIETGE